MKIKFIISIAFIFLLFNSCKKIREKVFSTRIEGKVIDIQTGKGIPNARLVVYEDVSGRWSYDTIKTLKTFYADQDGNFKDKIKIAFPDKDSEAFYSYYLKAEPDGYEKIYGNNLPNSGTGIKPSVKLNLTKANKDLELKCNPEFELDISIVDNFPYFTGTNKHLWIKPPSYAEGNDYYLSKFYFNNENEEIKTILPMCTLNVYIRGFDTIINPNQSTNFDSISLFLNKKTLIKLEY